jgi:chromosomal replication initiator protein
MTRREPLPSPQRPLKGPEIIEVVGDYYRLGLGELLGPCKERRVSWPRQMAMALMRSRTRLSTHEIARMLGLACHTTVLHGLKKVAERRSQQAHLQADFDELNRRLTCRTGGAEFVRHRHVHGRPFATVRKSAG